MYVFQTFGVQDKKHLLSIRLCTKTEIHSRVDYSPTEITEIKKYYIKCKDTADFPRS